MSEHKHRVTAISITALCAALTAVGTFISIPLPFSPVPIVLQNFFAILTGLILGPAKAGIALALYLVAGTIGVPIFAGGRGGIAALLGPTGGYLIGYLIGAIVAGLVAGEPKPEQNLPRWKVIVATILGLCIIYVPGLIRLAMLMGGDWLKVLSGGLLPFIPGDIAKGIVLVLITPRLRKVIADSLYE